MSSVSYIISDILSPVLFYIFINDIIGHLNDDNSSPPNLINKTVGRLLYANDLIILSTSPLGLQNNLNKLNIYCNRWTLEINQTKSKIMCFHTNGKESLEKCFTRGHLLEQVAEYPYLGLNICNSGSFKAASKALTA